MVDFTEADELVGKGKGDKSVKITANDLIELRNQNDDLQKTLKIRDNQIEALNARIRKYETDIKDMESKCGEMEKKCEETNQLVAGKNKAVEELSQKYDLLEQASKDQIGQLHQHISNDQEAINLLQTQNNDLKEKIKKTLERVKASVEESKSIQQELMATQEQLAQTQQQLTTTQQQLLNITQQSQEHKALAESTKQELEKTQEMTTKMQEQTKKTMEKLREIAQQKKELESKASEAVDNAEVEELKKKLAEAEENLVNVGTVAQKDREKIIELEKEIEELKKGGSSPGGSDLASQLKEKTEQVQKMNNFMLEMKKEKDALKKELDAIKGKGDSAPAPMGAVSARLKAQEMQQQKEREEKEREEEKARQAQMENVESFGKPKLSPAPKAEKEDVKKFEPIERPRLKPVQRDEGDDDNAPPKKFGFRGGPIGDEDEPSGRAKLKHVEPEEDDRPKKFGFKSGPVEEPEEEPSYDSNNTGPLSMEMEDSGQLKCKKCGSTKVAEVEDKDQVIAFSPRIIYGTKYRCMTCRNEWI